MKDQIIERIEALRAVRKYEMALTELAMIIGEHPEDAILYVLRGSILKDQEKLTEAAEACEQALKIDANLVDAHNLLGIIEIEQGFTNEAEKHLTTAREIEPHNTTVLANLTRLYLLKSKPKKAIESAKAGLAIEPEHQHLNNSLFLAYSSMNMTAEADVVLKRNLSREPDHLETLFNHAVTLMLKKQYHEAEIVLISLLRIDPNNEVLIQTFKEAATANNAFYRFVDGATGTWTMTFITLGAWYYTLNQVDDTPSRFYWTLLLLILIWVGWLGTYEGIGRLIAFFRKPGYWPLYTLSELLIATGLPVLLALNLLLLYQTVLQLLAPGSFPWLSFAGCVFLPLLQFGLGWLLDHHLKVSKTASVILSLSLGAVTASFFLGTLWWVSLLPGFTLLGGYFLLRRRTKD